ncbi:M48 family metallopeptidase [Oceanivirga salmonicida]|uniref:M48 family metallopeptidase n=1 Tax=Oceanivirga salmonicida TaxID=1769291 RepID=UPI0027D2F889|nr:YgjP-like metallopeptidase domain-containing protein [Oceanivirga salmonicida]
MNLRINSEGNIYISVPFNIDNYYIEQFIISKKTFIDKHIDRISRYKELTKKLDIYVDNSFLSFYGKKYILNLKENKTKKIYFEENRIIIENSKIDKESIKSIVYNDIYYNKAKRLFMSRLKHYLELMNENNDIKFTIGNMKGKWGMCRPTKREIVLNIELMKKSLIEIDSVIVHEITHLKHPNHSKNFYKHIDKYFPDYKQVNKKLNQI